MKKIITRVLYYLDPSDTQTPPLPIGSEIELEDDTARRLVKLNLAYWAAGSEDPTPGPVLPTGQPDAAANLYLLNAVVRVGGGTIKPGEEVFVIMANGRPLNWKNTTNADIPIPASPTIANMKAAGLEQLIGTSTASSTDIITTWQTARTAWRADAKVDFTKNEPALTAANVGKIYWSTATGAGSKSPALTFDKADLYEQFDENGTITWREYKPQDDWTLSFGSRNYIYAAGDWVLQPGDKHEHPRLVHTATKSVLIIYDKKLYINKVDAPDLTLTPADAAWVDTWEEFKSGTSDPTTIISDTAPPIPDYDAIWLQPVVSNETKKATLTITSGNIGNTVQAGKRTFVIVLDNSYTHVLGAVHTDLGVLTDPDTNEFWLTIDNAAFASGTVATVTLDLNVHDAFVRIFDADNINKDAATTSTITATLTDVNGVVKVPTNDSASANDYRFTVPVCTCEGYRAFANIKDPITNVRSWVEKQDTATALPTKGTLHDAGHTTPIAVKDTDDGKLLHCEGGAGYSFDIIDVEDGDVFHIVNKSGAAVASAFSFAGFNTVFDLLDRGKAVTGAYPLQPEESRMVRITENAGNWFANIGEGVQVYRGDVAPPVPDIPALWYKPVRAEQFPLTLTVTNNSGAAADIYLYVQPNSLSVTYGTDTASNTLLPADTLLAASVGTVMLDSEAGNWYNWPIAAADLPAGGTATLVIPTITALNFIRITGYPDGYDLAMADATHAALSAFNNTASLVEFTLPPATATDFDLYAAIDGAWVLLKKGGAGGAKTVSPDTHTYTEAVDGGINFVVDSQNVGHVTFDADGRPKWTLKGGLDPDYYQGTPLTIAERDALVATDGAAKAGFIVYVKDVAAGIDEYQFWNGSVWKALGQDVLAVLLGTFSGKTIPDNVTIKAALQALETKVETVELLGDLIGSFLTFADLPAPSADIAHDIAAVQKDTIGTGTKTNPQYPAGFYAVTGAGDSWGLILRVVSPGLLSDAQAQSKTDDTAGLIAGKTLYDREQAIKGVAANFATNDAGNAVAKVWDAAMLGAALDPLQVADVAALQGIDSTNLRDKRDGYIKATKEAVYFDKAATSGDYKPTTGPGYWLKTAGTSATTTSTAISFNQDLSLMCTNTWTARSIGNIGDTTKDFGAPDASNHYPAKRDMVIDVSVTAMTSEGSGYNIGFAVQLYRASTWVNCYTTTSVSNPSAGVVPFHQTAQIAIKSGDYIRFQTNANDGGGNTYPGVRTFRIGITEAPSQTLVPANRVVLTDRAVTGSTTGTAYDDVKVPFAITPEAGKILDTVTATGGATVTDINPILWTFNLMAKGAPVAISHTSKAAETYRGPQIVGTRNFINANGGGANGLSMGAAIASLDLGTSLQENDKILFDWRFNGSAAEDQSFELVVKAGTTQRSHTWTDRTEYWAFPATLTSKVGYSGSTYASAPTLKAVTIFRYAENKVVIPTGYQTRENCAITASGGSFASGLSTLNIPTGTGQWVSFTLGSGNELKSCSGSAGLTVGTIDMKAGAAWVEVANGTTSGTLTVVIGARNPTWALTAVNAGVAVTIGSVKVQLTASGSRNFQIASATGARVIAAVGAMSNAANAGAPAGSGIVTLDLAANGAFQSPRAYNFSQQGNMEMLYVEDQTNNRKFTINCEVGASFNNNIINGWEI